MIVSIRSRQPAKSKV